MKYDVYDLDEDLWRLWDSEKGFLCGWLTQERYHRFWKVQYGVIGRTLPGRFTVYRGQAEEWEKNRNEREKERNTGLSADLGTAGQGS